jgi:hypothetical protein
VRRFSIRTLMAVIVISAVGLAALRNANDLWAAAMSLVALTTVGIAMLGAVILRGKERCCLLGFAAFSGGYFVFALTPLLASQFGTTPLLSHLREAMFASTAASLSDADAWELLQRKLKIESSLARLKRSVRNFNSDPAALEMANSLQAIQNQLDLDRAAGPHFEHFQRVGHALFALLSGLLGGLIAGWLYARRERAEAAAGREAKRHVLQRDHIYPSTGSLVLDTEQI